MAFYQILIIFIAFECSLCVNLPIYCNFTSQINFEQLQTLQYTCDVRNDLPNDQSIIITSSNGTHELPNSNDNVTAIAFVNRQLFFIPSGLRTIFKQISALKIDNCPLKFISRSDFNALTSLKALQITNTSLQYIGKNIFIDLTALELLDLRYNNIFYIDPNIFEAGILENLTFLLLSGNSCDIAELFQMDSTSREEIEIFIAEIDNNPCSDEANVHERFIEGILSPAGEFEKENRELKEQMVKINSTLEELEVKFEKCEIEKMESEESLKQISLKFSFVEKEKDEFMKIAMNCTAADTSCLFLNTQDGYTCSANKIVIKSISDRTISWKGTHLSGKLDVDVKVLLIKTQETHLLPLNVGKTFVNLEVLIVESSKVSKLRKSDFEGFQNLTKISVIGNEISSVESATFEPVGKTLKYLELSNNKLASLPSLIFGKLKSLEVLNLSNNKLTQLRYDLIPSANSIKHFHAENNNLKNIDIIFVWYLKGADIVDFSGNSNCNKKFDKLKIDFTSFFSEILSDCS